MVRCSPSQVVPNTPGVWLDFMAWNLWSEDYHNFWSWSSRSSLSMEHCHGTLSLSLFIFLPQNNRNENDDDDEIMMMMTEKSKSPNPKYEADVKHVFLGLIIRSARTSGFDRFCVKYIWRSSEYIWGLPSLFGVLKWKRPHPPRVPQAP